MSYAELGGLFSHEAIDSTYLCRACGGVGYLVMEYSPGGKEWWRGKYVRYIYIVREHHCETFGQRIKDCFDEQAGRQEDYRVLTNNCKHFARDLYNRIVGDIEISDDISCRADNGIGSGDESGDDSDMLSEDNGVADYILGTIKEDSAGHLVDVRADSLDVTFWCDAALPQRLTLEMQHSDPPIVDQWRLQERPQEADFTVATSGRGRGLGPSPLIRSTTPPMPPMPPTPPTPTYQSNKALKAKVGGDRRKGKGNNGGDKFRVERKGNYNLFK